MIRPHFVLLCAPLLAGLACKSDEQPTAPALSVGAAEELGASTIGAGGGTLEIGGSGSAVDGLKIEVPAGAFAQDQSLKVSAQAVQSLGLGEDYQAYSPLVTIETDLDFADAPIVVRVPAQVPAEQFAMAFAYDAAEGRYEALPLLASDDQGVAFAVQNFDPATPEIPADDAKADGAKADNALKVNRGVQFLLLGTHRARLLAEITTAFDPSRDTWPFPNRGSIIAPGGHCAGQTVSMLYHYHGTRKSKPRPALRTRWDSATPAFWEDDARGYKLASVLQNEMETLRPDASEADGETQYNAFALGMLVSKEPQLVQVWQRGTNVGHALLAYRMDAFRLFVVDPNYPDQAERPIALKGTEFETYEGATNAAEAAAGNSLPFDEIYHLGAGKALLPWKRFTALWAQVKDGSIGYDPGRYAELNVEQAKRGLPRFPLYTLAVNGAVANPLKSGLVTPDEKLAVVLVSDDDNGHLQLTFYKRDGATVTEHTTVETGTAESYQLFRIPLAEGDNTIGTLVRWRQDPGDAEARWLWAGFEWFDIKRGEQTAGCPAGVAVNQQACLDNTCYQCNGESQLVEIVACGASGCTVDPDPKYGCMCNE